MGRLAVKFNSKVVNHHPVHFVNYLRLYTMAAPTQTIYNDGNAVDDKQLKPYRKNMKIALIVPQYNHLTTGNAVTVHRISKYLTKHGCHTKIFSIDSIQAESLTKELQKFSPDIIHGFHALKTGTYAREAAATLLLPFVITLTGTDIYNSYSGSQLNLLKRNLRSASAIVCFHNSIKTEFSKKFPFIAEKCKVIPQGVELPSLNINQTRQTDNFTFFLPAGLRPVKNVTFPLNPFLKLHYKFGNLKFILAGPVIDKPYAERVKAEFNNFGFAEYAGEIPFEHMQDYYISSDVVLNCSISEGGMANSLLEAMSFGKAVLASNIEGNSSFIKDGENGFLYNQEEDFIEKAQKLILSPQLRLDIGKAGRKYVEMNCSPDIEAKRYIKEYENLASF